MVRERTTAALDEALDTVQADAADGSRAVAETLARLGSDEEDGELPLGHQDRAGSLMAGSLARAARRTALGVFVPHGNPDEGMWVRSRPLPDGGWINVATSMGTYHHVGELMLVGAVWTVAIAVLLALVSGALLSQAVLRRLSEIAATAEGVRAGTLSRRAPVSSQGGEFDRLSEGLNAMLGTIPAQLLLSRWRPRRCGRGVARRFRVGGVRL